MNIQCKSVVGGWQTCVVETGYLFGPVFNSVNDLWAWQRANLYAPQEAAA